MAHLVDQFGNPIDRTRLRQEEAAPTVTGIRQVQSGHPAQGLTPQRLARLLRAAEDGDPVAYLELAEEMEEKDLHYRSVLSTRKRQVSGLTITVEAASDAAEDIKDAALVEQFIQRQELQGELFDIMDAVGKGFSVTEILWDTTTDGLWMPARLEWRDPRWFQFDRVDGRTPLLIGDGGQQQPLKPYGYVVHVHKSKSGLPIRGGLARAIAWAYLFKNFDIKAWNIFGDAFGQPLRLGKYGPGASKEDKAALLAAVRNIAQDAAAIIPQGMMIEFVEASVSGNLQFFERTADWWDRQVSKAVLGQTGTTDVGQHTGTADAHERVRSDIEADDCAQLSYALSQQIARPIVDLNRGPRRRYPVIRIFRPDTEDIKAWVENIATLVPMGLEVEESIVRDKLGIPEPAKDAKLLGRPSTAAEAPPEQITPQAQDYGERLRRLKERRQGEAPPHDGLDDLAAEALGDWQPLMEPLLEPIAEAFRRATSFDELKALLDRAAGQMDPAALAEALAQAAFFARLAGEAEMLEGGVGGEA